jgi:hypothetical protein
MLRYITSAVSVLVLTPALAGEPCCSVVSVDAARKVVAVQPSGAKGLFEVTVADAAQLRTLAKGQSVSLSGSPLTLLVYGNGADPQSIGLANVRYVASASTGSTTGAVGSAASNSPSGGTFRRDGTINGGCPAIKETPTQQCVLTHDNSSSGRGCEYFCVSLR